MLHHILVKWKEKPADAEKTLRDIDALFRETLAIPGVEAVELKPNVVDRPNRYDLLIVIRMERKALEKYDACDAHHRWKEAYGPLIDKKAIFDCE